MSLLKIIKNNLFIQNIASSIIAFIHPYLENTISKYSALKKAFFITAHDDTLGDYLEFGVFTGSSFNFAIKMNRKIDKIFNKKTDCQFVGFDSFRLKTLLAATGSSFFFFWVATELFFEKDSLKMIWEVCLVGFSKNF